MKRNLLLLAVVGAVLIATLITGLSPLSSEVKADQEGMAAAGQLFEAGNYSEAIGIYEQFVAQGAQDSILFYNLGNAYYRQGNLGRAILNYQRASQLNPRDKDIQANLALARAQAIDPFPAESTGPVNSLANMTANWLTVNETAVLALGFWFLAGLLFLAWRQLKPGRFRTSVGYGACVALFLVAFAGISMGSRLYAEETRPEGVVVAPVVAVSTEPGEQFVTEFSLQSGTEIRFAESQGDWVRLDVPEGVEQGWVPAGSVELVAWHHPI